MEKLYQSSSFISNDNLYVKTAKPAIMAGFIVLLYSVWGYNRCPAAVFVIIFLPVLYLVAQ